MLATRWKVVTTARRAPGAIGLVAALACTGGGVYALIACGTGVPFQPCTLPAPGHYAYALGPPGEEPLPDAGCAPPGAPDAAMLAVTLIDNTTAKVGLGTTTESCGVHLDSLGLDRILTCPLPGGPELTVDLQAFCSDAGPTALIALSYGKDGGAPEDPYDAACVQTWP